MREALNLPQGKCDKETAAEGEKSTETAGIILP